MKLEIKDTKEITYNESELRRNHYDLGEISSKEKFNNFFRKKWVSVESLKKYLDNYLDEVMNDVYSDPMQYEAVKKLVLKLRSDI